jgi:hypothetical protein
MHRCLIVAHQTLGGQELNDYLAGLSSRGPLRVHVVVPVPTSGYYDAAAMTVGVFGAFDNDAMNRRAQTDLDHFVERLGRSGIVATGELGPGDPLVALAHADRQGPYDELVVSTLPPGISRWLRMDVPHRARRRFGDRVTTIIHSTQATLPTARDGRTTDLDRAEAASQARPIRVLLVDASPPHPADLTTVLHRTRLSTITVHVTSGVDAATRLVAEDAGGDDHDRSELISDD